MYVVITTKDGFMDILNCVADNALFSGIPFEQTDKILKCSNATVVEYKKGEILFWYKDHVQKVGIVVSGNVIIARNDEFGNKFILYSVGEGGVFGLLNLDPKVEMDDIYVYASSNTKVIFMDSRKLLVGCENKCGCHERILYNALTLISERNIYLIRKQCHMAQRTMRKKIISYLTEQMRISHSDSVELSMNRQEWADYLGVDRSALSAELSNMQKDGIICYKRNHFMLCK